MSKLKVPRLIIDLGKKTERGARTKKNKNQNKTMNNANNG